MKKALFALVAMVLTLGLCMAPALAFAPVSQPDYAGIDVSVWQGGIDFAAVAQDGIDIVYIRAGAGSGYTDPNFEQNYQGAKDAGLHLGFYYYVTARSASQARYQARYFATLMAGKDYDCRPAMDFEDLTDLSTQEANAIALAFLEELAQTTGQELLIYADSYNASAVFGGALTAYPLWVAEYGVSQPPNAVNWETWAGWQYTDRGRVAGIQGNVDRSHFTAQVLLENPARHDAPAQTPPQTENVTYTVERGDTLWAIARRYHTTVAALVAANDIANPNLIFPGQRLRIPIRDDVTTIRECVTVRRGDTLWGIAQRYHTTVAALARENGIANPNLIFPGQRICVSVRRDGGAEQRYTVRRGDTLWAIARRYHTTVAALVAANNIANPNLIYPGQQLLIA